MKMQQHISYDDAGELVISLTPKQNQRLFLNIRKRYSVNDKTKELDSFLSLDDARWLRDYLNTWVEREIEDA